MFVFLLIACSSDPYPFLKKEVTCRVQHFSEEKDSEGVITDEDYDVIWNEDYTRSEYWGTYESGYTLYNEYGFVIEEQTYQIEEDYDREEILYTEYDCTDEWCWRNYAEEEISFPNTETIPGLLMTTYEWDGKKEYFYSEQEGVDFFQFSGHTIYNEYAKATEEYSELEVFHAEKEKWILFQTVEEKREYECDDWCKLQSITTKVVDDTTKLKLFQPDSWGNLKYLTLRVFGSGREFIWTNNHVSWGTGYALFNDYGYAIEVYEDYGFYEYQQQYTYDCED